MLAAILFCGVSFVGCGNNNTKQQPKEENKQVVEQEVDATDCDAAVVDYLVNVIGKSYAEGELCIPSPFVISADYGNPEDVKVWGDFWVFNYNQSGDTLKTVSGGNHPGLMHLKKTDKGMEVTNFEVVEDGAGNLESAKKLFGDQYEAFHEINRKNARASDCNSSPTMRRRTTCLSRWCKTMAGLQWRCRNNTCRQIPSCRNKLRDSSTASAKLRSKAP